MNLPEKLERDAMDSMPDMVLKMWNKTNETLDYLKEREADKQWNECNACFDNEHDECEDERCECPHKKSSPEAPQERECTCGDVGEYCPVHEKEPQEKGCEHHIFVILTDPRLTIHCVKCKKHYFWEYDKEYDLDDFDKYATVPAEQIDVNVKELLEEYAEIRNGLHDGERDGFFCAECRRNEKRMSEIEKIINQAIKK